MPETNRPFDAMRRLVSAEPVAIGQLRWIFTDPYDERLLIKVLRSDAVERRWGSAAPWTKRVPRARHYSGFVRELKEYIIVRARHPERVPPIARMVGLVETDLGLGLVTEKVRGVDDGLAPTLAVRYARERGFSAAIESDLAAFLDDLLACGIVIGDMHAWNIVHGSDSRGATRLVLVDGFGEKHAIPLTSMSAWLNRRNTRRLYWRMRAQLEELVPLETPASD